MAKEYTVVDRAGCWYDWTWDEVDRVDLVRAIELKHEGARIFDGDTELSADDLEEIRKAEMTAEMDNFPKELDPEYDQDEDPEYQAWLDRQETRAMAEAGITPWFFPPEDGLHDF